MIPHHTYRESRNNGYGRLVSLIGSHPMQAFGLVVLAATAGAFLGHGWVWAVAMVVVSWLVLAVAVALGWWLRARTTQNGS